LLKIDVSTLIAQNFIFYSEYDGIIVTSEIIRLTTQKQ